MRPILFYIGRLPIRAYGTMMMLAFAAGIAWAVREARRRGLDPGLILDLAVWIMVSGIVFARAIFIALDPALTWRDLPYIWRGGLSFHGGLIGGVLAALVFVRLKRIRFWTLADTCAPSIALAYGIARIGCLLNGCCYGRPATLPWGIVCVDPDTGVATPPSHPTQVYSALASWALFAALVVFARRSKLSGSVFLLYLMAYGVIRFLIEYLRRGVTAQPLHVRSLAWLTEAQLASIIIFVGAGLVWWWLARRAAPATQ
jgi:phosphatidylglycerol:prolipoprotein diacylglycerol transferase